MDLRANLLAAVATLVAAPLPCLAGGEAAWEAQAAGVLESLAAARVERGLPGGAKEYDCGSAEVSVVSEDEESAALACEGFQRARRFMAERGHRAGAKLSILVAERFPERYRKQVGDLIDNMHGFYDTDTREVHMKTLGRFLRTPAERTPQEVGPSRELERRFRSSGGSAFSSRDAVNDFAHDADPGGFAVRSYLFLKGPEGERALRDFMDGKVEPSGF